MCDEQLRSGGSVGLTPVVVPTAQLDECTPSEENWEEYPVVFETDMEPTVSWVWEGQNFTPQAGSSAAASCPSIWVGSVLDNTKLVYHGFSGQTFRFRAPLVITPRWAGSSGIYPEYPHAYYAQTTGEPQSINGYYKLTNGEGRFACLGYVALSSFGQGLWIGKIVALGAIGTATPISGQGGGGEDDNGGWVYYDEEGNATGDGSNWATAKHNWDVHRACTVGYVIFENGVKVCTGAAE